MYLFGFWQWKNGCFCVTAAASYMEIEIFRFQIDHRALLSSTDSTQRSIFSIFLKLFSFVFRCEIKVRQMSVYPAIQQTAARFKSPVFFFFFYWKNSKFIGSHGYWTIARVNRENRIVPIVHKNTIFRLYLFTYMRLFIGYDAIAMRWTRSDEMKMSQWNGNFAWILHSMYILHWCAENGNWLLYCYI